MGYVLIAVNLKAVNYHSILSWNMATLDFCKLKIAQSFKNFSGCAFHSLRVKKAEGII